MEVMRFCGILKLDATIAASLRQRAGVETAHRSLDTDTTEAQEGTRERMQLCRSRQQRIKIKSHSGRLACRDGEDKTCNFATSSSSSTVARADVDLVGLKPARRLDVVDVNVVQAF